MNEMPRHSVMSSQRNARNRYHPPTPQGMSEFFTPAPPSSGYDIESPPKPILARGLLASFIATI